MNTSVDMCRVAVRTSTAARRRRQRILSSGENGAIVEYDSFTTVAGTSPSYRIPVPPRHALTRPFLVEYYKLVTGKGPEVAQREVWKGVYNYSWFIPVGSEEREVIPKSKRRLDDALIAAKIPLRGLEEIAKGVFDSGHMYAPIYRSLGCKSGGKDASLDSDNDGKGEEVIQEDGDGDSNATVLLVRPVARELLSEEQMMHDEMVRVAPKGREWDRQHALRHGIGPTAQEALIDSHIDTRYRRPGDYVRRNWRGDLLDARGCPMRAVSKTL